MEKNGKYILLAGAHKSCSFKLIHVYHIYLNEKYCYHTIHMIVTAAMLVTTPLFRPFFYGPEILLPWYNDVTLLLSL